MHAQRNTHTGWRKPKYRERTTESACKHVISRKEYQVAYKIATQLPLLWWLMLLPRWYCFSVLLSAVMQPFFWETLITCSPAFSEFSSIFWNIKYLCYILALFICHSVFLIIETPRTLWVVDTFHSKHLTTISTSIWSTKNVHGYMHIWLHLLSYWGTESVLL